MLTQKLPNAAASVITVTSTATSLFSLIDTAAGEAANLSNSGLDSCYVVAEDGDVRVLMDTNTPTASNGFLVKSGSLVLFDKVPLDQMKLIRVGSTDVSVSLQVGKSVSQ